MTFSVDKVTFSVDKVTFSSSTTREYNPNFVVFARLLTTMTRAMGTIDLLNCTALYYAPIG